MRRYPDAVVHDVDSHAVDTAHDTYKDCASGSFVLVRVFHTVGDEVGYDSTEPMRIAANPNADIGRTPQTKRDTRSGSKGPQLFDRVPD
ncbi:hypothetical protein PTKU15_24370 [Paraburkholderia terrae]|nr:hypothetical protein PTKU15_24370 [Paraburkholderia terrae]